MADIIFKNNKIWLISGIAAITTLSVAYLIYNHIRNKSLKIKQNINIDGKIYSIIIYRSQNNKR